MAGSLSVDDVRWSALADGHPDASIFHHPRWTTLLADCYGYEPHLCAVEGDGGRIEAGIPLLFIQSRLTGRRAVGLPFTDFCPPLLGEGGRSSPLLQAVEDLRRERGWPKVEIRWGLDGGPEVVAGERSIRHTTVLTDDPDALFRTFKKTRVQQPVRQASDAGVVVRPGREWDDVLHFYRLHLETRRRLGVPTQPKRFFRLLWERLIAEDMGFVLLAEKDRVVIAGAVFLHHNGVLTYKYSASDSASWRLRPNNLLLWEAIRGGCEAGMRVFDWGRTDLDNDGLRQFKRGWAAEETEISYSVLTDRGASQRKKARGGALKPVIQRSPVWVSRAIGELLYGHFG